MWKRDDVLAFHTYANEYVWYVDVGGFEIDGAIFELCGIRFVFSASGHYMQRRHAGVIRESSLRQHPTLFPRIFISSPTRILPPCLGDLANHIRYSGASMRRLFTIVTFMAIATAILAAPAVAQNFAIGSRITELALEGESGPVTISPSKSAATLVIFVSRQCPVSNAYNSRMNTLQRDYSGKNVQVIFVNPNITETAEDSKWLTDTTKLGHTVYRDLDNKIADKLNAQFTPEAYVFDAEGVLRYHGAIDDAQNESKVQKKPLRDALDAVLAKKPVGVETSRAFGCSIKRKKS